MDPDDHALRILADEPFIAADANDREAAGDSPS
jgi:hypothetical protein